MHVVADTRMLQDEGVITSAAAKFIEARSREVMMSLAINAVLCAGIIAATFGLIFWLADAALVAVTGLALLGGGLFILSRSPDLYRMFGNAAALIGAGMLIGGAGIELVDRLADDLAGAIMALGGLVVAAVAGRAKRVGGLTHAFVAGSIFLMGVALHLSGVAILASDSAPGPWLTAGLWLYGAVVIAAAGCLIDVRLVTALAIVPFAQVLDTGTGYFGALYAFWSPESTLTILQMAALVAAMIWMAQSVGERVGRHALILAIMAFVVANLSALVGSLFGDVIGQTLWGPGHYRWSADGTYADHQDLVAAFELTTLKISADVYSIFWAIALAGIIWWAAHTNRRGLFNAGMTFAAIHAYTQMFETFADEPLAYVIGGFAAIPLAWGMWRLNQRFMKRSEIADTVRTD